MPTVARGLSSLLLFAVLSVIALGCPKQRAPKVPGETDVPVAQVEIRGEGGAELSIAEAPLLGRLGLRRGDAVQTPRHWNPFRLAEDRRRVAAFWHNAGFLDAEVLEPEVRFEDGAAQVTFTVREGPRYALASITFRDAPEVASKATREGLESKLRALVPDTYDIDAMRVARYAMAELLQRQGYGHARVYTRFHVDRARKEVHAVYHLDRGPETVVGRIEVRGNRQVETEDILARISLREGERFDLALREASAFDLLDTGAFASAHLVTTADVETYVGDVPDSGGVIPPERIDEGGNILPRTLSSTVDVVVNVIEAPAARLRARAGAEADPTRGDVLVGAELRLRNVFGSQHHLGLEARVGYGRFWDRASTDPGGLYYDTRILYTRPGLFARLFDARVQARFRDVLFPGFRMRELTAGPGVRATLWHTDIPAAGRGLFLDLDLFARLATGIGLGPFDDATRAELALPANHRFLGAEAQASLVWDDRDDPLEPKKGTFFAARATYAPGGALGTHGYLLLAPEARAFVALSTSWSIGLRGMGGWVFGTAGDGVPLGPRLFGGGAFGMRGYGRDRLSPVACAPWESGCFEQPVGGLSLVQSSLELRYLPLLKQTGFVVFADVGGAGRGADPFDQGVDVAVGIGPRLRLWYVPISVDYAIPLVRAHRGVAPPRRETMFLFLRIGEAF